MKIENNIQILNKKYNDLLKKFVMVQRENKRELLKLREARLEIQRLTMLIEHTKRN